MIPANQQDKNNRSSSVELLRIIAMIMIVFHHFSVHGGFHYDYSLLSIPRFWVNYISMGGKIGVDVFVLISGYFLITAKGALVDVKRIFKLWSQIFLYSIGLLLFFGVFEHMHFGVKQIGRAFLPVIGSAWWFASAYFVMYVLHPFVNKMLLAFDKKMYQGFLIVLFVCWSVIPTFLPSGFQSNSLTWFIFLYSLAGYVRVYGINNSLKSVHYFGLWFGTSVLTYLASCSLMVLGTKWKIFGRYAGHVYAQNSITILLISFFLFMAFVKLKMNYNRYINTVASATFGVYLIHDSSLGRPFLWKMVFHNASYQDSLMVIPYSIIVVAIVYIACTIIDLIRKYTIEAFLMKTLGNSLDGCTVWVNNKISALGNRLLP